MRPQRKVLRNGLRIIAVPMKDNPTVTVLVLVEAGSHYETKTQNGISHFLEHMCFKGTTNRPSPYIISHELDALGAESNAFTWYEFTGYYAKGRAKHFPKLLDVVADMYLNPTVPAEELEKEKGVIIEEINMYDDQPMRDVGRLLDETLYGDQPAGRSVLGTKETVRALRRDEFLEYRAAHYVPNATTVIIAGNVTPKDVFADVKHYFNDLPRARKPKKPRVVEGQRAPHVEIKYKKSSQAHFNLGFRSVPVGHKDLPAIELLKTILGQGMSSRLFKKLRDEMGVCYYVRALTENHSDHGKFIIASGVDTTRLERVLKEILIELARIRDEVVPEREFKKAKEFLFGNVLMGLESSDERAEFYGMQEILHQTLKTPEEYLAAVKRVTPEDVRRVARTLFRNDRMNLALIGPYRNPAPLKKLLKI